MKQQPSSKGLNMAIWLLVAGPVAVLILWITQQDASGTGPMEQWLRTMPISLLVSVVIFAVLRGLIRKHGEEEVRAATKRASNILAPLALIALLLLLFGLPLYFLWLGSSIWGGS